jgi:ABC-type sulfate transport system substrate-binding protein
MRNRGFLPAIVIGALLAAGSVQAAGIKLLNVSYDPTRELYQDVNGAFAKAWKAKTGQDVSVPVSYTH